MYHRRILNLIFISASLLNFFRINSEAAPLAKCAIKNIQRLKVRKAEIDA